VTASAHILSFDLGKASGWARFNDGQLTQAGFCKFEQLIALPPEDTSIRFGREQIRALILIETPHHLWRSTTEDLIKLGIMVGRVEEFYSRRGCRVEQVKPVTWKGSVDAEVMLRRILNELTPQELSRVPLRPRKKDVDHNCGDAIGQGLWKLGRMHG
jgi:hypothetical protein